MPELLAIHWRTSIRVFFLKQQIYWRRTITYLSLNDCEYVKMLLLKLLWKKRWSINITLCYSFPMCCRCPKPMYMYNQTPGGALLLRFIGSEWRQLSAGVCALDCAVPISWQQRNSLKIWTTICSSGFWGTRTTYTARSAAWPATQFGIRT